MDISKARSLRQQGKSYRQIGKQLGVHHSTVAYQLTRAKNEKAKFQQPAAPVELDVLQQPHLLPPAGGRYSVAPYLTYSGQFRGGQGYYLPADIAIRDSRENARNMFNSLVVREPLQARLWAAAENEWHIEPEDKKDASQIELARKITKLVDDIPDFLKMRYSLLKSRWFGVYGCQLEYNWDAERHLTVKRWSELHADSLAFKMDSDEVGVYVTAAGGMHNERIESEAGYIGRVHKFSEDQLLIDEHGMPYHPLTLNERQAVIIMSYDPQASDFLDPRSAGGVKGLGLRSTCYPTWLQMNEIIGWMIDWLERFGTGVTMYKFIRGNEASYLAAKQLAESADVNAAVMVPVDMESGKVLEGVERMEPSPVGLENIHTIVEWFASQIRKFIVGQDATSQPVSTGLGSEIAQVQESTFGRIIHFDCIDLQETLTRQLVRVIQDWSFPGSPPCKFIVDFAKPNVGEQIANIKSAWDMGVSFVEDEIRSLCGASKPTLDDITVSNKSGQQPGGLPGMPLPGLGKPPVPGLAKPATPVEEEQPFQFAEQEEDDQDDDEDDDDDELSDEQIQELGVEAMQQMLEGWKSHVEDEKVHFAAWEEKKHPRADDGKFGSGSGHHKSDDKPAAKDKPQAEPQGKLAKPTPQVKKRLNKKADGPVGSALGMAKDTFEKGVEVAGSMASIAAVVTTKTFSAASNFVSSYAAGMEERFGRRGAILVLTASVLGSCAALGLIPDPISLIMSTSPGDVWATLGKGWDAYKAGLDWAIDNVPKAASTVKGWWDALPEERRNGLLWSMPLLILGYTIATTKATQEFAYNTIAFPFRAIGDIIHTSAKRGRRVGKTVGLGDKKTAG